MVPVFPAPDATDPTGHLGVRQAAAPSVPDTSLSLRANTLLFSGLLLSLSHGFFLSQQSLVSWEISFIHFTNKTPYNFHSLHSDVPKTWFLCGVSLCTWVQKAPGNGQVLSRLLSHPNYSWQYCQPCNFAQLAKSVLPPLCENRTTLSPSLTSVPSAFNIPGN